MNFDSSINFLRINTLAKNIELYSQEIKALTSQQKPQVQENKQDSNTSFVDAVKGKEKTLHVQNESYSINAQGVKENDVNAENKNTDKHDASTPTEDLHVNSESK
ncbi:MAG: hypothetical protein ACRYGG_11445 [Janthinobacterium lividum]